VLIVDPEALAFLSERREDAGLEDPMHLRLIADGTRFEVVPDRRREGDRVYELDGEPVLLVGDQVAGQVADRVLEIRDAALALGWQAADD
jgi:hypothetical protein